MKSVLLSPQAVRVIDYLNSVNHVPTIAEIGSAVGLSASTTWRILKSLRSQDIKFKAVTNLANLGLTEILLMYRTRLPIDRIPKKLLRSLIRTLEGVTLLRYVTKVHEVESSVNYVIAGIGVEPSEVYVLDTVIPPKYVSTHIARGSLDKIYLRELIAVASAPHPLGRSHSTGRVDPIDIALVNELEEDALIKIKDVYKSMKKVGGVPSYQTILKHYRVHILERGVIVGIRPTLEKFIEKHTAVTKKLLVMYGTPHSLSKGVRAVTAIPGFMEAYLNAKEGVAYTVASIPLGLIPKIVDFLGLLESRGLVKEWMLYELDPTSSIRYPIPEVLGAMSVSELLSKSFLNSHLSTP
ncbi:MAG: hypothetical protein QXZ22_01380 [Sulfolobales archaeon]